MVKRISFENYMKLDPRPALIDVRTPGEYASGHIPGAFNIPLFSNDERAKVGTSYKQVSVDAAYKLGYKFVEPKLESFVEESRRLDSGSGLAVYCWRGGMRSKSFAEHIEKNGLEKVFVIEGGYKAFRTHALASFMKPANLLILGGYTGSGKTMILKVLKEKGCQVIDLEGIACHKGSAFGGIGQAKQPENEHFTNLLYWQWKDLDPDREVWLEDESIHIGKVFLPEVLFERMRLAQVFFLKIEKEKRAELLVRDYPLSDKASLEDSVRRISKRLGGLRTTEALEALKRDDFYNTALITLDYYDKFYLKGLEKRACDKVVILESDTADPHINAELLLNNI